MFRLAHPEYLNGFLLLPLLLGIFLFALWWRSKAISRLGDRDVAVKLFADKSTFRQKLKFFIFLLALASVLFALCGPQLGTRFEEVKRKGSDILICLDVSNSMNAEDIRPSRLERAKQAIYRLVDKMQGDRIGIIVFAGQAYVQLPITTDYNAAKLFLSSINSTIVPTQGTAIGSALSLALESMGDSLRKNTSIIVISDGENHEDDAVAAAREAADQGVIVHTIGMGSPAGAPIPIYKNGVRAGFMQDHSGQTVLTRLNPEALQEVADAGKGKFVLASNNDDGLETIFKEIDAREKREIGSKMFTDYEDQFRYFTAFALMLLLIDFIIIEKKSSWVKRLNLFGEKENKNKSAA